MTPSELQEGPGATLRSQRLWRIAGRVLGVLALAMAVLAGVLLVRTARFRSAHETVPPAWTIAVDEDGSARRLLEAVHIPTVSRRKGADELEHARLAALREELASSFPRLRAALDWEEIDGSLLLTWKGNDPALKPLLMLAHLDVVPAAADAGDQTELPRSRPGRPWAELAFGATLEETEGFIVGRGTLDDKVSVVGLLEAAQRLLDAGFAPRRTVVFAFGRDEEVGGKLGAVRMAAELERRGVRPECILDEGSFVLDGVVPGLPGSLAPVGIAEKGYVDVALTVTAEGGHSSLPPRQTAIGILAAAIARLESHPFPARIDGVSWETLQALGPELEFGPRLLMANLWLFEGLVKDQFARSPPLNALIRTTAAVTIVQGGTKDNVLPASARAIVNLRLLPGDSAASALAHVARVIDDPRVTVAFAEAAVYSEVFEASRVSRTDTEAYRRLSLTIRQSFPGALVVPYLVTAGTDSRHYQALCPSTYRFLPIRLAPADLDRIHGADERIGRRDYTGVVQFYARLIKNFDR
jgi:carboxypeptidase PM20D1